MAIHIEETYACTPEVLWRHLEEPELQKQWMHGVLDNRATSTGPTRVGSTFEMDIKEGGKTSTYRGVMTAWEPYRHMALSMQGGCMGGKSKMIVSYRLEPITINSTKMNYTCDIADGGRFMSIMFKLFGWFAKMQAKKFFRTLRTMVEKH